MKAADLQPRVIFLYILIIGLSCLWIDRGKMLIAHINFLKVSEDTFIDILKGKAEFRHGPVQQTLKYYQYFLHFNPNQPLVLHDLAAAYLFLGDYKKAEDSYRRVLSRAASLYTAYYDLGLVHAEQGQWALAVSDFEKALAFMQRIPQFSTIDSILESQMALNAENQFLSSRSLKRREQDKELIYILIAHAYFQIKNYPSMLKAAQQGIQHYPPNAQLYFLAGTAYFYLRAYDQALPFFRAAQQLNPRDKNAADYEKLCLKVRESASPSSEEGPLVLSNEVKNNLFIPHLYNFQRIGH